MKYKVIQQHFGDKQYYENDERVVDNEQDAEQLINMGLIQPFDDVEQVSGDEVKKPVRKTPAKKDETSA